jgi:hypothetical protein
MMIRTLTKRQHIRRHLANATDWICVAFLEKYLTDDHHESSLLIYFPHWRRFHGCKAFINQLEREEI